MRALPVPRLVAAVGLVLSGAAVTALGQAIAPVLKTAQEAAEKAADSATPEQKMEQPAPPPYSALEPVPRRDQWWQDRHKAKLAEKASAEKIELVFVGDSITHGWEGAGREVWAERFAPRGAIDLGYGGDQTQHVLWRIAPAGPNGEGGEIDGLTPKLFVVMIGTNNTGSRLSTADQTAEGVEAVVDRLLEASPGSKVLLLAIFPRSKNSDDPLRLENDDVNDQLQAWADGDRVHFLDIGAAFLNDDGSMKEDLMPDLLHPNTEGYRVWADAIEQKVASLMGE